MLEHIISKVEFEECEKKNNTFAKKNLPFSSIRGTACVTQPGFTTKTQVNRTGGVRCERASALVNHKIGSDIQGVYQLYGGVEKYMQEFPGTDNFFFI